MRFLVAESEPPEARRKRRASVGASAGETFLETLARLAPGCTTDQVKPADADAELKPAADLAGYDAVFVTGSPLHVYDDGPDVAREIAFMRAVFDSGTPAFGSCAGLQVATVAAGGSVRPLGARREAGFARGVTRIGDGHGHPLLATRPDAWDAPAIHTDEVEALPSGGRLLATDRLVRVQAAEIHHGRGIFWGVQYHPEISLGEVAGALRRDTNDLIEHGLARSREDVEAVAQPLDELDADPARKDLAWRLGLDEQVIDRSLRETELRNFIERLVRPTMMRRGR